MFPFSLTKKVFSQAIKIGARLSVLLSGKQVAYILLFIVIFLFAAIEFDLQLRLVHNIFVSIKGKNVYLIYLLKRKYEPKYLHLD